jgi:aryl-alcohol dehydrogenase-like predicted oxidoreductase
MSKNPHFKNSDSQLKIIHAVEAIAKARGISMAQVALAWSISKPYISAPIIGTTSLEKLDDLIEGCSVELTKEEIEKIDSLYEAGPIKGH